MTIVRATSFTDEIAALLKNGGVGVLRTDTLYGLVARADSEAAVERVYRLKHRTPTKSPIVLIADISMLFDTYDGATIKRLKELWPGKNSIILPSKNGPRWVTRGNGSVAYRMPEHERLRALVAKTGPLIAPSANPESQPPAAAIEEAVAYFGNQVDFYVDGGEVNDDTPSRLYRLAPDDLERLR